MSETYSIEVGTSVEFAWLPFWCPAGFVMGLSRTNFITAGVVRLGIAVFGESWRGELRRCKARLGKAG